MAIIYIEKGHWLHDEVERQGHVLLQHDGVWQSDDDVAVQGIVDSYDTVPDAKKDKRGEALAECLIRCNAVYGGEDNEVFENAASVRVLLDINASYREVVAGIRPRLTQVFAVWTAFQDIKTEINQLQDLVAVESYNVINNVLWP